MKLKLIKKQDETKDVVSFFWKPEGKLAWRPGQYYYYTLPNLKYADNRGDTRHFTISSSPTEGEILRLTTKFPDKDSGFKKTLAELPVGAEVEGEGPNGMFILDEKSTSPNIFIAGGIGITPFRSMIKYLSDKNSAVPVYLIYSNSDDQIVFEEELKEIDMQKDNIHVEFFNSSASGHLDKLKIEKFIENWKLIINNCTFWVCGPPPMVSAIEEELEKMEISGDNVKSERFSGY